MRPYAPIGLLGRESGGHRVTAIGESAGKKRGRSRRGMARRLLLGCGRRRGQITTGLTKVLRTGMVKVTVVASARQAASIGPGLSMAIGATAIGCVSVPTTMAAKA